MAKKQQRTHHQQHLGIHHIIPSSRGGSDSPSNLYFWSQNHSEKHTAWHALFINKMPEEAIALISVWKRKDGKLNMKYFQARKGKVASDRLRFWKILFDDMKPAEAIAWIEREFIRKEWLRR